MTIYDFWFKQYSSVNNNQNEKASKSVDYQMYNFTTLQDTEEEIYYFNLQKKRFIINYDKFMKREVIINERVALDIDSREEK